MLHTRDVLPPGTVLDGKYRIDGLIGAGGFGMTYRAHDIGLNLTVAVKEYYPAQFGMREGTFTVRAASEKDQDLFDRLKDSFLREAKTLAQFRHPAIVRVVSVFEGHGTAYMIMEFEQGHSLKHWLDGLGRRPTQGELDGIVMPLLDALDVMHKAAFLHRDIAPDNIIVRADGSPVLLDFGAARRVMAELSGALTGVVKQGYSPQEQYANDPRAQGPWSDIYALGATLYRCVTGIVPTEATLRMLDDTVQPASTLVSGDYRPGFLAAIDRALSLRPKDRPQSIAEFRKLLAAPPEAAPTVVEKPPVSEVVPGAGGWSRISLPPKAHISERYADVSSNWKRGIGALALVSAAALAFAMMSYASKRTDVVKQKEAQHSKAEPNRAEQRAAEGEKLRREMEAKVLAERERREAALKTEAAQKADAAKKAEADRLATREKQGAPTAGTSGVAPKLEAVLGDCNYCDDVRKATTALDFAELRSIPQTIDETWTEVRIRRGPREDAAARKLLEQIVSVGLEPDPLAAIKTGQQKCTLYNFGFLDNAAERVGTHQCMVRMVRIGGNVTSLTLEKLSGDGFFADIRSYRVNAMAFLARSSLKGHAITRYNLSVPKNKENDNFGNAVGIVISIGGKAAFISINKNGFSEPDRTFFSALVLDQ